MKKVGEKLVPKTEDEFDAEDIKKVENYAKAINMLYYAVNPDDYRKISCCTTAKEMWDKLEADAIYESIGVSNVTIDGLRGNLKAYESTILTPSLDEQKKKGIALKATKETVEEVSSDDDNEFGLVIKKFHKFMKKEFERKGRKHDGPPKCYGCGEIGHIKPRCPRGKNGTNKPGFKKKRAYISWGVDSSDESTDQEEDEAANLCLMAHEDQPDDIQEGRFEVKKSGSQGELAMGGAAHPRRRHHDVQWRRLDPQQRGGRHSRAWDHQLDLPQRRTDDPLVPPEKRLLLSILTRILRPRDGSHTSLFNEDLKVIHAIMHGTSTNWAKFVMIHMTDCASLATERSLPYAFLVMDIIISADIHIAGPSTKMMKLWVIADNTFKKKSGDRDGAGPSRARVRARAPAPALASLQSIADTLNRLTLTVDDNGQYMERMD
ncbi:unnamed protein product [Cuscuta campestris]|uniref:CCHC-type domain-containing protein n=1 Tax=Cuscuta campestris TaxID=132261 RepID=A0A484KR07_9ASTE|nr:unnamed protein product [Cuscuta campestris]